MSNLPIMYLLLLLLGFQAPQAQGRPFPTYQLNQYLAKIDEIMQILNKLPLPSQDPLDPNETEILRENTLLRPNLDAFLKAAENFHEDGLLIRKNLKEFLPLLPTPTPRGDPIHIEEDNWVDFQRKLTKYLEILDNFLNFKEKH
ncbi:interleukin-3 [Leopardus geoffroyi]|uniref:interleukin-3 n=1 Tax=Leopardus geoffroyi TaxID=46844 RepID=UPI001E26072C|nr:interleukin-3 [Leopardus geoffroyi]